MRKKDLLIFITVITLIFAGVIIWATGIFNSRYFGVRVLSPEVIENLVKENEGERDYDRILFNGNPVIRDSAEGIIYVSADAAKEELEGVFSAVDGKLFFEENQAFDNPMEAIAGGEELTLWYMGKDKIFSTKVVVSTLPIMSLTSVYDVAEETWGGTMELLEPEQVGAEYLKTVAEFSFRGNISKSFEKKGYKLSLSDKKLALCGLRKDDDWILNALYDDIGLVRNATCMRLWNEISALNSVSGDKTCEGAFIELIVDNEYKGVYLLCERVDKKTTGVGKDDLLYKFKVYAAEDDLKHYAKTFEIKEPSCDDMDKETINLLKQPMLDFMWKTYVPGSGRATYEEIKDSVYLDNAADYLIFCLATSANDNRYKNSFVGAIKQSDETYKFYQLPWDMNSTFGITYGFKFGMEHATKHNTWSYVGGSLYSLAPEEFGKYVNERYSVLRQSVLSEENMKGIVSEYLDLLEKSGAVKRNYDKYPHYRGNKKDIDYKELFTSTQLQDYIDAHMTYLDEYMAEEIAKGKASPDVPDIYNSDNLQENTTDAAESAE